MYLLALVFLQTNTHTHTHTHTHRPRNPPSGTVNSCNFPITHRKWFLNHHHSQIAMDNMVFPYHLFTVFIFIPFLSLVCLFPWCFYLRHQKTPPACSLPPSKRSPPPKSPRAVRMICKLQTTKSPGLVSSAHLGNSISQGGQAQRRTASPSCPLCPRSSDRSLCGLSATNVSLQWKELRLGKSPCIEMLLIL